MSSPFRRGGTVGLQWLRRCVRSIVSDAGGVSATTRAASPRPGRARALRYRASGQRGTSTRGELPKLCLDVNSLIVAIVRDIRGSGATGAPAREEICNLRSIVESIGAG